MTEGAAPPAVTAASVPAPDVALAEIRAARSFVAVARPWLEFQARQVTAAAGAVFSLVAGASETRLERVAAVEAARFDAVVARVLETGEAAMLRPEEAPRSADIGHPLRDDDGLFGVVALRIADATPQRLRAATRSLQWGAAWLTQARHAEREARHGALRQAMREAHEVFAATLERPDARAAALEAAARLARLAQAERVSIGLRRRRRTRIAAISHSAGFGRTMALNRAAAAAMDEALDQRAALLHPAPADEVNVTRAQAELSTLRGGVAVLTAPFRVGDRFGGAVTVERPAERPFTAEDVAAIDFAVSLAGPALWEKTANDKWLIAKVLDTLERQTLRLVGAGHAGRKLLLIGVALLSALLATWSGPYAVTADARIEGRTVRALVAPFDGFISAAALKAGERVRAGDVVAALDDRDLVLERLRRVTELRQRRLEYERALGEGERSEAQITRAQIEQAEAQIELIEAQLARAVLRAPFDGLIISGDLSQDVGGSVERGAVLFEIAPDDGYRVALDVDEARLGDVRVGAAGVVVLTALPETGVAFRVERFTPVAALVDGRNTFRYEAAVIDPPEGLAPAMRGVAKIEVDHRLRIVIWTRGLVDWARLKAWELFG